MRDRTCRARRLGTVTAGIMLGASALAACGGSGGNASGGTPSGQAANPATGAQAADDASGAGGLSDGDALAAAADLAQAAIDNTSSEARATLVIDGITHEFRPLQPGPDDDFYSFCTVVAGSLQGVMQLVDANGARVEGGAIDFILLEPGGAFESTGDPAELMIELPDHVTGYREEEINAPASGRRAAGSFTVSNGLGDSLTGTIDASC